MYNILICDDEKDIVNALKIYLNNPEYNIYEAYNGQMALEMVTSKDIHLLLLDIMMPVMDGITALYKIRETSNIPIIMLSAKSEDGDKILGLNIGADDYITKPFNPLEVVARVNSQLRRYTHFSKSSIEQQEEYEIGSIVLNDSTRVVSVDGKEIAVTPKEFDILKLLMSNPGKIYSPKNIYQIVWKEAPLSGDENTVAVHIRHLREKIEINPNEPRYIKVVFGQGYKMEKGRK